MADQPQRNTPTDGSGCPPPVPLAPQAITGSGLAAAPPSDDTPTIISKVTPRPPGQDNLFNGILRGRKLAHFELIEPIGVGGMAAVLRARDTQLDRFVALKILPPEMASDPEIVARFRQEARAAARLDHETIARVFYCGEDQNLHFIAFEFVEGENLRALIDRRGPLPVPEALHYMLQVATGLAHAASRGVVHRDIKPSNIIISPNGRAKLVDMGLARNLGPHSDDGLTQSGVTLGTFDYISPEQALEPRDADVRSDLYSLGCTFYHALTGQAPVPEGTAARKLHHHQHVPPIDPRQLNPDIPDEVAAILGRLMAKDPRQRYQRPEHLVQHLLQATHRLGAGAEAPDGVLFVDAALPAPPRTRPLLVAGCAAAIVVILVLVIGPSQDFRFALGPLTGNDARPTDPLPDQAGGTPPGGADDGAGGAGRQAKADSVPAAPERVSKTVDSADSLAEFARTMVPTKDYEITLAGDLRLGGGTGGVMVEDGAGIVLRGHSVTLKSADGQQATVWSRYVARAPRWGGLVIEADTVSLSGLRVVADASDTDPGDAAAGVWLRNVRAATVSRCEFLQGNCLPGPRFSSLAIQPGGAQPHIAFDKCCFLGGRSVRRPDSPAMSSDGWLKDVAGGGQVAVAVLGTASVSATNCAFGPHAALFAVSRSEGKPTSAELTVDRCTALAGDEWALASLGEKTTAAVTARSCLFGRIDASPEAVGGMMMPSDRKPTACLVRYAGTAGEYKGTSNRYLNLDAVRLKVNDDTAMTADSFAAQLAAPPDADEKVLPSDARPWNPDLLKKLQGSLQPDDLLAAFRLDFTRTPDLRYSKYLKDGKQEAVVGLEQTPWGTEWTAKELQPLGGAPAVVVKVVDPTQKTDAARGIYRTLAGAIDDAKSGDVIAIRGSDEMPISPIKLAKSGVSLTIRPEGNSRPKLLLDQSAPESQAALFHVHSGQLNLERLDFRLRPAREGFKSQAVALVFGDGGVQFTRCAVTLDGRQATAQLAAVVLADADEAMMQPGGSGVPRVAFDSCFVRGDGDLISARVSRPFEVAVKDSLAALTGSLLNVDDGRKDAPAAPGGKEIAVRLDQTTAYLGGHLVRLRAASMGSLVPVHCFPSKSLLVSAGDKKALLHLEAAPKDLATAAQRLDLKGEGGNNYANFAPMLDQQPGGDEMPTPAVTKDEWKQNDDQSKFEDVKFAGPLWTDGDVSAAEVLPRAFVLKTGPKGFGVSSQAALPAPATP
jgi:hypothetical protein